MSEEVARIIDGRLWFYCPGCGSHKAIPIEARHGGGGKPVWDYTGPIETPTLSPSVLGDTPAKYPRRCHLFLRKGQLQFLSDCTHELRGQTVPLPPLDLD